MFITISSIYAQPTLEWARRYNGPANDYDGANAVAFDRLGNVYVTGSSIRIGGGSDYCTIKYNSVGDSLWVRRYGESNYDGGEDIVVDSTGNAYVTGAGETIKYNTNGSQIWVVQNNAECSHIAIVNGFIYTAGSGYYHYVTSKLDSGGNLLWRSIYNAPGNSENRIKAMVLDAFGNIIVTGDSYTSGTDWDYCTIKYSQSGDSLWVRRYNGIGPQNNATDYAYAVTTDLPGNVYVTGWSRDANSNFNILTIKYNNNGDSLWVRRYDYAGSGGFDIKTDNSGNVFVAGNTGNNYVILKYDPSGNLLASSSIYGQPFAGNNRIVIDINGYIYMACGRYVTSNRTDILVVKYNSGLNEIWEAQYHAGGPNDINGTKDIKMDGSGNIYIVGIVPGESNSLTDYITLKYSQVIGIIKIGNKIPNNLNLFQNYPNPFNPATKIKFDIPVSLTNESSNVKLIIFDVTGKQIQILINEKLNPGSFEISWNSINYPSGIYFCVLESENYLKSIKMLLIK